MTTTSININFNNNINFVVVDLKYHIISFLQPILYENFLLSFSKLYGITWLGNKDFAHDLILMGKHQNLHQSFVPSEGCEYALQVLLKHKNQIEDNEIVSFIYVNWQEWKYW